MYGQKNFNEIQGINGKYRIAQIGCFLVGFSNLLKRDFGKDVDPLKLNALFRDNGIYIDVDDGIRDDLGWNSISRLYPEITVTATGKGAPNRNRALVKFNYKSPNSGNFTTHFALVVDWQNRRIIDSWDGVEKDWNVYGGPIEWASYDVVQPQPVAPVSPAPAADSNKVTVQAGWGISHVLKSRGYPDFGSVDRWNWLAQQNGHADYTTFRLYANQVVNCPPYSAPAPAPAPEPDFVNVTVQSGWGITSVLAAAGYSKEQYDREEEWDRIARLNGSSERLRLKPGQVLKVYKAPLPLPAAPTPAPAPEPTPAPTAPAVMPETSASDPAPVSPQPFDDPSDDWQESAVSFTGKFVARESIEVIDLEGKLHSLWLPEGTTVQVGSKFTGPDGQKYYRSIKHTRLDQFYGIPEDSLRPFGKSMPAPADDDDIDRIAQEIAAEEAKRKQNDFNLAQEARELRANLTSRQNIVKIAAQVYGTLQKLKFWKRK